MTTEELITEHLSSIPLVDPDPLFVDTNGAFLLENEELCSSVSDTDIFKYFLNDELQAANDETAALLSSPISDSSEATPPQLSPESLEEFPTFSGLSAKVKDENDITMEPVTNRKRSAPTSASKEGSKDAPLALSRDELLKLSSKGLETYTQTVTSNRSLSVDEERQLKRQRRLIKNRESAQLSRLRKKVYIEELERKVNQLTSENDNLVKQVNTIAIDKKKLQDEVAYLHNIIKQSPALSSQLVNTPQSVIQQNSNNKKQQINAKNVKAAGICLLVVLFSFGLLFNSNPGLMDSKDKGKNLYAGRMLKSIKEESNVAIIPESAVKKVVPELPALPNKAENIKETMASVSAINAENEVVAKQIQVQQLIDDKHLDANPKKRKMKIADEPQRDRDMNFNANAKNSLVAFNALESNSSRLLLDDQMIVRPNTAYIFCSEAQHVTPINSSHTTSAGSGFRSEAYPENIALLIPSSVLNASVDPRYDASLLEVSCQVMNLHLWPMQSART